MESSSFPSPSKAPNESTVDSTENTYSNRPSNMCNKNVDDTDKNKSQSPVKSREWEKQLTVKCRLCGGATCNRCSESAALAKTNTPIKGLHADWVTDRILGMMRPSSRLIQKYDIITQFQTHQIKAVFNLTIPGEHPYCGDQLCASGFPYDPESDFMTKQVRFYNFGWEDMTTPTLSFMMDLVKVMASILQDGHQRIAVHCHAGYGRTGLAIACVLLFMHNITPDRAIHIVRRDRPGSIQTAGQTRFVRDFHEYMIASKVVFQLPTIHEQFLLSELMEQQNRLEHGIKAKQMHPKILEFLCKSIEELTIVKNNAPVGTASPQSDPDTPAISDKTARIVHMFKLSFVQHLPMDQPTVQQELPQCMSLSRFAKVARSPMTLPAVACSDVPPANRMAPKTQETKVKHGIQSNQANTRQPTLNEHWVGICNAVGYWRYLNITEKDLLLSLEDQLNADKSSNCETSCLSQMYLFPIKVSFNIGEWMWSSAVKANMKPFQPLTTGNSNTNAEISFQSQQIIIYAALLLDWFEQLRDPLLEINLVSTTGHQNWEKLNQQPLHVIKSFDRLLSCLRRLKIREYGDQENETNPNYDPTIQNAESKTMSHLLWDAVFVRVAMAVFHISSQSNKEILAKFASWIALAFAEWLAPKKLELNIAEMQRNGKLPNQRRLTGIRGISSRRLLILNPVISGVETTDPPPEWSTIRRDSTNSINSSMQTN